MRRIDVPYCEKDRRCNAPCPDPELAGFRSEHFFHIVTNPLDPVQPRHGNGFEEHHNNDGVEG